jgi:serine/threonine protein kinase
MRSCVAPVYLSGRVGNYYYDDTFFASIGLDISLSGISEYLAGYKFTKHFIQFVMDRSGKVVIMQPATVATVFGTNHYKDFFKYKIASLTTDGSTDWESIYNQTLSSSTSSGYFTARQVEFPSPDVVTPKGSGLVRDAYVFYNRWDDDVPDWISVFISSKDEVENATRVKGTSSVSLDYNEGGSNFVTYDLNYTGTLVDVEIYFASNLPDNVVFIHSIFDGNTSDGLSRQISPGSVGSVTYEVAHASSSNQVTIPMLVSGLSDSCSGDNYWHYVKLGINVPGTKNYEGLIIGLVIGFCAFLALVSFAFGRINFARRIALKDLIIHRSLYDVVKDDLILHYLDRPEHVQSAKLRDYDKRTALEIALNHSHTTSLVIYKLLIDSMPFNLVTGDEYLKEEEHNYAWATVVQSDDERAIEVVSVLLAEYPAYATRLSQSSDRKDRLIIDIASPRCKKIILRSMYLYRRYEILSSRPEHKSDTSLVILAVDHVPEMENETRRVALKFMTERDQFKAELHSRSTKSLSSEFIVELLTSFDSDCKEDKEFFEDAAGRGFKKYGYCVVLSACDESLKRVVDGQNIVGDMGEVSRVFKQIVMAVQHIHERGVLHGDLKRKISFVLFCEYS